MYSVKFDPPDTFQTDNTEQGVGDSRTGSVYVFNDRIRLSVQVALATGRPLLVRGESGWGKSSLATAAARYLGWDLFDIVVTSRTQARDLQWEVDLLQRLNDAQGGKLKTALKSYVRPGVLWKAFDPQTAREQQTLYDRARGAEVEPPSESKPGAVVLIDEIDKADPDVPNNLLVTVGSLQFQVDETGQIIKADKKRPPLLFITTNEERELPAAFLRRCIELQLPALNDSDPDGAARKKMLVDIVMAHRITHDSKPVTRTFIQKIADLLMVAPPGSTDVLVPNPAEFKDTILALVDQSGTKEIKEPDLKRIARMTITKWKSVNI